MLVAKKLISDQLSPCYPKQEIESLSRLILEKITGYSRLHFHINQHKTISAANLTQIKEITDRLCHFEPIQYILGETEFYGLTLKVNHHVLIPRPETEELVDWIIRDYRGLKPALLDVGTGSGCIAVALVKNIPGSTARAWDISTEALHLAKENADSNLVAIDYQCVDVLHPDTYPTPQKSDLIVSNPPYVTLSEKKVMHPNVTDYEPHLALFVPDEDALIFYRAIAGLAPTRLNPGGSIYLEINERLGNEISELLSKRGFVNITLKNDINDKPRMIKAVWPDSEK